MATLWSSPPSSGWAGSVGKAPAPRKGSVSVSRILWANARHGTSVGVTHCASAPWICGQSRPRVSPCPASPQMPGTPRERDFALVMSRRDTSCCSRPLGAVCISSTSSALRRRSRRGARLQAAPCAAFRWTGALREGSASATWTAGMFAARVYGARSACASPAGLRGWRQRMDEQGKEVTTGCCWQWCQRVSWGRHASSWTVSVARHRTVLTASARSPLVIRHW